jgi:hypothetical protein
VGTRPFSEVDLLRDNESIYRNESGSLEVDLSHRDLTAEPGSHYYYVRLRQVDGQTAWSSPIWVDLRPERRVRQPAEQ